MSKQSTESYLAEKLSDNKDCQNMIDFIACLKMNKISVKKVNANKWVASYGDRQVCYIQLSDGDWTIVPRGQYFAAFFGGEVLQQYIWESVNPCNKCSSKCAGIPRTVCGKVFDDTCVSIPLYFKNPSADALRVIERVIEDTTIKLY